MSTLHPMTLDEGLAMLLALAALLLAMILLAWSTMRLQSKSGQDRAKRAPHQEAPPPRLTGGEVARWAAATDERGPHPMPDEDWRTYQARIEAATRRQGSDDA